jgi:hypothetical protein
MGIKRGTDTKSYCAFCIGLGGVIYGVIDT